MSIQTFASLAKQEGLTPEQLASLNSRDVRGTIDPGGCGEVHAVYFFPDSNPDHAGLCEWFADTIASNDQGFKGAAVGLFGPLASCGSMLGVVQAPR